MHNNKDSLRFSPRNSNGSILLKLLQTANDKQFKNLTPLTPGMFGYSILRSSLENPLFQ